VPKIRGIRTESLPPSISSKLGISASVAIDTVHQYHLDRLREEDLIECLGIRSGRSEIPSPGLTIPRLLPRSLAHQPTCHQSPDESHSPTI